MSKNSNIEYIDYYIKELESRHGDIDEINKLKRLRKLYLKEYQKQTKIKKEGSKKKIKKASIKKQIGIGILTGTLIGIPAGIVSYNNAINAPSVHNYTTVREKRLNIEHDNSNYKKYLRNIGLTEEQITKRIEEEERINRWNREQDELDER